MLSQTFLFWVRFLTVLLQLNHLRAVIDRRRRRLLAFRRQQVVQRIVHPLSIFAADTPNMFAKKKKNTRSASTLPTFTYFTRRLVACPLLWKRLAHPCRTRRCPSSFANRNQAKTLAETAVLQRQTYSARPLTASESVGTVKEALTLTIEPNRTVLTRFG